MTFYLPKQRAIIYSLQPRSNPQEKKGQFLALPGDEVNLTNAKRKYHIVT